MPTERNHIGEIDTPAGKMKVLAFVAIKRDERETHILHLDDGSYAFTTKSWLLENDRKEVVNNFRFSENTFVQLIEALHLSAVYFGINLNERILALADCKPMIDFEYGGNGKFPEIEKAAPVITE